MYNRYYCCVYVYVKTVILLRICICKDVNIVAYMYMYRRYYCCVYVYVKTVILWRICICIDDTIVVYM